MGEAGIERRILLNRIEATMSKGLDAKIRLTSDGRLCPEELHAMNRRVGPVYEVNPDHDITRDWKIWLWERELPACFIATEEP